MQLTTEKRWSLFRTTYIKTWGRRTILYICTTPNTLCITGGPGIVINEEFFCHEIAQPQVFHVCIYIACPRKHHLCIFTKLNQFRTLLRFYRLFSTDRGAPATLGEHSAQENVMSTCVTDPREIFAACDIRILAQVWGKCLNSCSKNSTQYWFSRINETIWHYSTRIFGIRIRTS